MPQNYTRVGATQQKILVLLQAGLALGLNHSPKKQWWILKQIPNELRKIDRQALERAINSLYSSHLVAERHDQDGMTTLILSEAGKRKALQFNINKIEIKKPKKWDNKWRIAMFDIPEKKKRLREALRFHFREIGLLELQKSVFVFPYPCEKEIEFVVEFYNARRYVRLILAEKIDNQLHFMKKFRLC